MPASLQARLAAALAGLAVWATVSPWLGEAVGLGLDVATRLEIADHVIPGLVALAAAALLATRGAKPGSVIWLGAGAIAFLTGLWITSTHVPLIPDALDGVAPWAPALLHLSGYVAPDGSPQVHNARATIQDDGDWKLEGDQVPAQLAQCGGYLSIQFTGFFERRIRGEQLAYELNAGQTRRP